MRIVFISDTHNQHNRVRVPEGDVLVHAGDATGRGFPDEIATFLDWFAAQPHKHKILIAGNHDWGFMTAREEVCKLLASHPGITYLEDSGCEIEGRLFWGSPWQPEFGAWAFNLPRRGTALRRKWNKIPLNTDVLVTHGPPYGVLDKTPDHYDRMGEHVGCEALMTRLAAVRPRIHAFGHIHGGFGVAESPVTTYINASICTEIYTPTNPPIVVDLEGASVKVVESGPSPRLVALESVKAIMASAKHCPEHVQAVQVQAAVKGMAEIRGMELEAIIHDYLRRGLVSDLAQLEKAEAKLTQAPIPRITLPE